MRSTSSRRRASCCAISANSRYDSRVRNPMIDGSGRCARKPRIRIRHRPCSTPPSKCSQIRESARRQPQHPDTQHHGWHPLADQTRHRPQDAAKLQQVVDSWPKPVSKAVVARLLLPRGKKATSPTALIQFADSQKGLLAARTMDQVRESPPRLPSTYTNTHTLPLPARSRSELKGEP